MSSNFFAFYKHLLKLISSNVKNLPVNFARMVADADKDIMAENIERFKAEYMKAIESGLSERLKGVPPKISREKENLTDPFLSGLGM